MSDLVGNIIVAIQCTIRRYASVSTKTNITHSISNHFVKTIRSSSAMAKRLIRDLIDKKL